MAFHYYCGSKLKSSTAPSAGPTAAIGANPKCNTMPYPVESPKDWVWTYAGKMKEPPSWSPEFQSLYQGCTGGLPESHVQELARRQAVAFRLPTAQADRSGWWDPLQSLSALCCNTFLPPGGLKSSWDIQETRKEKTLALAKALQSCCEQSGGPYSMLCGTAQDLQRCMVHLIWVKDFDVLEIPLLESADDESIVSLTPPEEAALLDEPQKVQATTAHPLRHKEQTPKPGGVTGMGRQQQSPQTHEGVC